MNLPVSLFAAVWLWGAAFLAVMVAIRLWRHVPWAELRNSPQLGLVPGISVILALAWSMCAGVKPGLNLHLLGAMAVTLCIGPRLALVAMGMALTMMTLNGVIDWQAWPLNFLLIAVLPVTVAHGLRQWVERHLPAHFFVFVFVVGFAGSALTVMLQGLSTCIVLALAGAYGAGFLIDDYLPYFLLLGFSEAWLSGALITLMVIYRPEWVVAFDDRRYLWNK